MAEETTPTLQQTVITIYSPSAIVNIIQNAYVAKEEKKLIGLRGVYIQKGQRSYYGFWYDELKDESSDNTITLIVPDLLRSRITNNKTIEIVCYISKKPSKNGTIQLNANITDLLNQTVNKYSDDDIKSLEVQQKKAMQGFRDLDSYIKKSIYDGRRLVIKIILGKSAIIDADIKHQMSEAVAFYDIEFVTTTISSIPDIIATLKLYDKENVDIIAISRGGGDDVEVLNKPELAEYCLNLKPFLVSAAGHKENVPLLEKIADRKFITPTAFGQYLKETYNNIVEDFEKSKAKLAEDVTKQLTANFSKQIANLNQQLAAEKELKTKAIADKDALFTTTITEAKNIHISEVEALRKQLIGLQSQFTLQNQEKEKILADKEKILNNQIIGLTREKEEKDKLISQSKAISEQFKISTDSLQKQIEVLQSDKTKTLIIAVIIAVILGIIIGVAIK